MWPPGRYRVWKGPFRKARGSSSAPCCINWGPTLRPIRLTRWCTKCWWRCIRGRKRGYPNGGRLPLRLEQRHPPENLPLPRRHREPPRLPQLREHLARHQRTKPPKNHAKPEEEKRRTQSPRCQNPLGSRIPISRGKRLPNLLPHILPRHEKPPIQRKQDRLRHIQVPLEKPLMPLT